MENDFTDKYNTQLTPDEENQFQGWAKTNPRLSNSYDYDARGFWKAGAGQSENGHGSDQFKKPNHPTFSDQSQYNGVDGFQGGSWNLNKDNSYSFIPSPSNLQMHDPNDLKNYFKQVEPGNQLLIPVDHNPYQLTPVEGNPFDDSVGNTQQN